MIFMLNAKGKINKIKHLCGMLCPGLNQGRTYSFYQDLSYMFDVFVNRMGKYTATLGLSRLGFDGERRKVIRSKRKHAKLS